MKTVSNAGNVVGNDDVASVNRHDNFSFNGNEPAQVDNRRDGVTVARADLELLMAELDDVTDVLLNLSSRLYEAAGFINDQYLSTAE